jgi:phage terminase large subunit-like protein
MSSTDYPFVAAAERYVDDVLEGRIPACKWVRYACQRHRRDVARIPDRSWPYTFDVDKAERAARFTTRFAHVKGRKFEGKKFQPEDWQAFAYCSVFGWVRKEVGDFNLPEGVAPEEWHAGTRRFRRWREYVPRKNGKSLMVAPIALYMLAADGEPGAEVYSGATSEKQAWEIFGPARQMALKQPNYQAHFGVQVNAKSLTIRDTVAKFEPLIGKPGDGASPHCSVTDEYHEHETDEQIATMETGMGARTQPLSIVVSTAGDNIAGPCRDDWLQCQKVLEGTLVDEELFAMIYTVDEDTEWTSEEALRMANPNFGVSKDAESLRSEQRQAINNPRKQGHFKTKHLNLWVQARNAYFNIERWRESKSTAYTLESMRGRECIMGMDLASKVDLAALEMLFPLGDDRFVRFGKYYLPRATVDLKENTHYQGWEKEGWLTVTEGNMIDYFTILEDIKEISKLYEVREVAYDPHNATMLVTALMGEGIELVEFGPTVLNFSEPMKQVDGLIKERKIAHNGDPVMEWALSNVVAKEDRKDNVYPNKERAENKIDPAVALIMAMGRVMVGAPAQDDFSGFINKAVVA